MKKSLALLAVAISLALSTSAQAGVYKIDFTYSNFDPLYKIESVPVATISGSLVYTADSQNGKVTSINGVDLTIAGHVYDLSEVGIFSQPNIPFYFGGKFLGGGITPLSNDFWLTPPEPTDTGSFAYTTLTSRDTFFSTQGVVTITEQAVAVPEPGSLALLLAGIGALGWSARRKAR